MTEPLRILHVVGGLRTGGAETLLMNLYRNIDREKVQFDFVKTTRTKDPYEDEILSLGGRIYTRPKLGIKNAFACGKWWKTFFAEHPEYKIAHGHQHSTAPFYLAYAKKAGAVTIAHSHTNSGGSGLKKLIKNFTRLLLRRRADYFMACSPEAAEWLFGKDIAKSEKCTILPNAIDAKRFVFSPEGREKIRRELGLGDGLVVGHVGRFSRSKNHGFLLETFAEIKKQKSDAKLLLLGEGSLENEIREKARALGITDDVVFGGVHLDLRDYYSAMDVFAFPSVQEGLGIVAVEAQACGLYVVKSEVVPDAVCASDLVKTLKLGDGAKKWAHEIVSKDIPHERSNYGKIIDNSAFGIGRVAQQLQQFYVNL